MNNRQTVYVMTLLTILVCSAIAYLCIQGIEKHGGGGLFLFGLYVAGGFTFASIINCLSVLGHDYPKDEQVDEFGMTYPTPRTDA